MGPRRISQDPLRGSGYLERYDATPDSEERKLARGWIDSENDVLLFFRELREKRPVLVTPACTPLALPEMVRQMLLRAGLRPESPTDYNGEHLPQEYHLAWIT